VGSCSRRSLPRLLLSSINARCKSGGKLIVICSTCSEVSKRPCDTLSVDPSFAIWIDDRLLGGRLISVIVDVRAEKIGVRESHHDTDFNIRLCGNQYS